MRNSNFFWASCSVTIEHYYELLSSRVLLRGDHFSFTNSPCHWRDSLPERASFVPCYHSLSLNLWIFQITRARRMRRLFFSKRQNLYSSRKWILLSNKLFIRDISSIKILRNNGILFRFKVFLYFLFVQFLSFLWKLSSCLLSSV